MEYFEIKDFVWQEKIDVHKKAIASFYPDVARSLPDNFSIDEYFHTSSANKKGSKIVAKLIHFGSGIAHRLLSEDYFINVTNKEEQYYIAEGNTYVNDDMEVIGFAKKDENGHVSYYVRENTKLELVNRL